MNHSSGSETWLGLFENFTTRAFNPCLGYLPCFRRQHQVHPEKSGLVDSRFIQLSPERRIRVIHIVSSEKQFATSPRGTQSGEFFVEAVSPQLEICSIKSRSHSIISNISEQSEDYWFTRWSRPLRRAEGCNCSFRKSWTKSLRDSKFSNHLLPGTREEDVIQTEPSQVDHPTSFISQDLTTIEGYVDILIQEVLHDAFTYLSRKLQTDETEVAPGKLVTSSSSQIDPSSLNFNEDVPKLNCGTGVEKEGSGYEMPDLKMGCINPNFIGSLSEPDKLDDNNTIRLSKTESLCRNLVLNIVHEQPLAISEESQTLSTTNSETKDGNNGRYSLCLDPIAESNTDQEVNLRKKNTICQHTSNSLRLKPVLFFLHGVGSSADLWSSLIRHFAKEGYEVVAPDMLGHGYSSAPDRPAVYTFHSLLKDALEIFDKFIGEQKICVLIGHAYGCSLAAAMARYRPQQVIQLVLISGGGPTPLAPRTSDSRPPSVSPCLQAFMKPLLLCGFRRDIMYAPCGKHISYGDAVSSGLPNYVLNHIARGQDWPEGDSAFHRRILVPTLLVHGMKDPYITLVQECEMERTIPRSFLEIIPNAGHFAMLESPKKLTHMIQCFVEWWSR